MSTIIPVTETHQVSSGTYIKTIWTYKENQLIHTTKEGDDTVNRWATESLHFDTPRVNENLRDLDKVTYEVNGGHASR